MLQNLGCALWVNLSLASDNFCRLLITFVNSKDRDHNRSGSKPLDADSVPERIFGEKVKF